MRGLYKKIWITLVLCLCIVTTMTGCKASKKKVLSSTYYKELQKEKEALEEENKKLQEELSAEGEITVDEQRAVDYLDKIARDRLTKLEVGYADNMEGSEFVDDKAVFSFATSIATRADITAKYTPDEVKEKFGPGYEYILYDEDNAIYEIYIYGGNYVVFADLPNNVYYAYNASALGEAFLNYKNGYPNSTLLHRLADAPLVTDEDGEYFENEFAFQAANDIDQMSKKKSSRKAAEKKWAKKAKKKNAESYEPESKTYTFYHHGNQMVLTIYDTYISIENMDGNRTWYKVSKEDADKLEALFVKEEEETETAKEGAGEEEGSNEAGSHSKEIEEESIVSTED